MTNKWPFVRQWGQARWHQIAVTTISWFLNVFYEKRFIRLNYTIRRRQWHPTPVLLPRKSHGQRRLEGCSQWGRWGSDTTERLHFHFHALEKEMATHSVLAWRIPGTGKPGGLPSLGSHRVERNWSNLASAPSSLYLVLKLEINITFLIYCPNFGHWEIFQKDYHFLQVLLLLLLLLFNIYLLSAST